ncbi:hypothetical protein PPL_06189 [Heterostelium album PN500]|uniref:Transmembrane protein n=1 Tax=Heterostelium pallidum (strain ATCC 26659 / Pp 5 / PN500) TaxID=670386 RepID=D3BCG4_HETP5|nr:hypothetical protein PPL_06189 [Heterostelium album PN500]EFA80954.1 hypothetical protein PPL_06189 [Heterostelium album PN500]|eukprot:XP_020433072.1 hypothetical protein PPL_06189 [Heterostelium album PN500]
MSYFKSSLNIYSSSSYNSRDMHLKTADEAKSCNSGIIQDWGFAELAAGNPLSPWKITNSTNFKTSFVRQLEEGFQDRSITGYWAMEIELLDFYSTFTYYINQSVVLPNNSIANEGIYISFSFDSPQMDTQITIEIDGFQVFQISPTSTQYERSTQIFYIPLFWLDGRAHNIIMGIVFFGSGINRIYIEDYKAFRMQLEDGAYPNLLKKDNSYYIENQIKRSEDTDTKDHEYYVASNGSDCTGDGTYDNPYASIQQAIYFASHSNSIINLFPGTYCGLGNSYLDTQSKGIRSNKLETGSAILISGLTSLSVTNCDFSNLPNNSITLNYLSDVSFYNSTFMGYTDYAIYVTGLLGNEQLIIDNCTFHGSSTLFLLNMDSVKIVNTKMPGFKKDIVTPNCAFSINMVNTVSLSNSYIGTTTCAVQTNMTLDNVVIGSEFATATTILLTQNAHLYIRNNVFNYFSTINCILAFHGSVTIESSIFNTTAAYTTVMVESCTLSITNTTFRKELRPVALDSANAQISNSTFESCMQFVSGTQSNLYLGFSKITEYDGYTNNFVNSLINSVNNSYTDVYSLTPIFTLYRTTFNDYGTYLYASMSTYIQSRTQSIVNMNYTTFTKCPGDSLIFASDFSKITVYNMLAKYNHIESPGCIFNGVDQSVILVYNSNFTKNSANFGGVATTTVNANLSFFNCTFIGNFATQTGGLVYTTSSVSVTMENVVAMNNHAREGSIIYYTQEIPFIGDSFFSNNTQTYGSEIALGTASFDLTYGVKSLTFIDSGSSGYSFYLQLQDNNYNNLTNKFCKSSCSAYISLAGQFLQSCDIAENGTAQFINMTLIGQVGSVSNLVISSNDPSINELSLQILFNNCTPGHQPSQNGQLCVPCQAGSYGTDGWTCSVCPANVICNGPDYLPATGYWIEDSLNNLIAYPCPEGLCGEGGNCTQDYTGPLCAACEPGFYNCGSGCKKTESVNVTIIILKVLVFFALVLFQQLSDDSSGLVTIALYFIQNLVVISNGIKFSIISAFSGSSSSHAGSSNSIISFMNDCIAPLSFYTNHYIILMQPLFLFVVLTIIIIIELTFRRTGIIFKVPFIKSMISASESEFRNRQFSAFIKICMNSYGPLITEILLILFCYNVGSYVLLNANPGIQCQGSSYETAKHITWGLLSIVILFPFLKYQPFVQTIDNHLETISLTLLFVCCIYLDNALWETTEQWILLLSLLVFIGAALKLQFQYYWNQAKKIATPILERIRACHYGRSGGRSRTYSQNHGANDTTFDYDQEQDDEYDENSSLVASNKDHIGKVDQRNNMSLSFRVGSLGNNNNNNTTVNSTDPSEQTFDSFSDFGSLNFEKIQLPVRKSSTNQNDNNNNNNNNQKDNK